MTAGRLVAVLLLALAIGSIMNHNPSSASRVLLGAEAAYTCENEATPVASDISVTDGIFACSKCTLNGKISVHAPDGLFQVTVSGCEMAMLFNLTGSLSGKGGFGPSPDGTKPSVVEVGGGSQLQRGMSIASAAFASELHRVKLADSDVLNPLSIVSSAFSNGAVAQLKNTTLHSLKFDGSVVRDGSKIFLDNITVRSGMSVQRSLFQDHAALNIDSSKLRGVIGSIYPLKLVDTIFYHRSNFSLLNSLVTSKQRIGIQLIFTASAGKTTFYGFQKGSIFQVINSTIEDTIDGSISSWSLQRLIPIVSLVKVWVAFHNSYIILHNSTIDKDVSFFLETTANSQDLVDFESAYGSTPQEVHAISRVLLCEPNDLYGNDDDMAHNNICKPSHSGDESNLNSNSIIDSLSLVSNISTAQHPLLPQLYLAPRMILSRLHITNQVFTPLWCSHIVFYRDIRSPTSRPISNVLNLVGVTGTSQNHSVHITPLIPSANKMYSISFSDVVLTGGAQVHLDGSITGPIYLSHILCQSQSGISLKDMQTFSAQDRFSITVTNVTMENSRLLIHNCHFVSSSSSFLIDVADSLWRGPQAAFCISNSTWRSTHASRGLFFDNTGGGGHAKKTAVASNGASIIVENSSFINTLNFASFQALSFEQSNSYVTYHKVSTIGNNASLILNNSALAGHAIIHLEDNASFFVVGEYTSRSDLTVSGPLNCAPNCSKHTKATMYFPLRMSVRTLKVVGEIGVQLFTSHYVSVGRYEIEGLELSDPRQKLYISMAQAGGYSATLRNFVVRDGAFAHLRCDAPEYIRLENGKVDGVGSRVELYSARRLQKYSRLIVSDCDFTGGATLAVSDLIINVGIFFTSSMFRGEGTTLAFTNVTASTSDRTSPPIRFEPRVYNRTTMAAYPFLSEGANLVLVNMSVSCSNAWCILLDKGFSAYRGPFARAIVNAGTVIVQNCSFSSTIRLYVTNGTKVYLLGDSSSGGGEAAFNGIEMTDPTPVPDRQPDNPALVFLPSVLRIYDRSPSFHTNVIVSLQQTHVILCHTSCEYTKLALNGSNPRHQLIIEQAVAPSGYTGGIDVEDTHLSGGASLQIRRFKLLAVQFQRAHFSGKNTSVILHSLRTDTFLTNRMYSNDDSNVTFADEASFYVINWTTPTTAKHQPGFRMRKTSWENARMCFYDSKLQAYSDVVEFDMSLLRDNGGRVAFASQNSIFFFQNVNFTDGHRALMTWGVSQKTLSRSEYNFLTDGSIVVFDNCTILNPLVADVSCSDNSGFFITGDSYVKSSTGVTLRIPDKNESVEVYTSSGTPIIQRNGGEFATIIDQNAADAKTATAAAACPRLELEELSPEYLATLIANDARAPPASLDQRTMVAQLIQKGEVDLASFAAAATTVSQSDEATYKRIVREKVPYGKCSMNFSDVAAPDTEPPAPRTNTKTLSLSIAQQHSSNATTSSPNVSGTTGTDTRPPLDTDSSAPSAGDTTGGAVPDATSEAPSGTTLPGTSANTTATRSVGPDEANNVSRTVGFDNETEMPSTAAPPSEPDSNSTAAPPPVLSQAQEQLTSYGSSATVAVSAVAGGSGAASDLQALMSLATSACAPTSVRQVASSARRTVTPLASDLGNFEMAVLLGQVLLILGCFVLNVCIMLIVKAVKKMPNYVDAAAKARCPTLSVTAMLLLFQGLANESARLVFNFGGNTSTGSRALAGIVLLIQLTSIPMLTQFTKKLANLSDFRLYHHARQPGWLKTLVLPVGRWSRENPMVVASTALLNSLRGPESTLFFGLNMARSLMIAVLVSIPGVDCNVQVPLLGLTFIATGIFLLAKKPLRVQLQLYTSAFISILTGLVAIAMLFPHNETWTKVGNQAISVLSLLSMLSMIGGLGVKLLERRWRNSGNYPMKEDTESSSSSSSSDDCESNSDEDQEMTTLHVPLLDNTEDEKKPGKQTKMRSQGRADEQQVNPLQNQAEMVDKGE